MADINIRISGHAGRITFDRPAALNAMTYDMCMAIDAALENWRDDDAVQVVVIDAVGEKAFCAGGDIAQLYDTGTKGDYGFGRTFWRDEYRVNAKIFEYPKPVVSFMQGFTMGGGVGIGCHGSHRVVGESSKIAMPECGIGLVPDVGGTFMLAEAPGRLGEYVGLTAARMDAGDAIHMGFADHYIPQDQWPALISTLEERGDTDVVNAAAQSAPQGSLAAQQADIDTYFGGETLGDILNALRASDSEFAAGALKALGRNSPLSMACTAEIIHRLRGPNNSVRKALDLEFRFTWRSMEHGDFLEGIRAQIIDKDRNPKWQFADMNVPLTAVGQMLAPLGENALTFDKTEDAS